MKNKITAGEQFDAKEKVLMDSITKTFDNHSINHVQADNKRLNGFNNSLFMPVKQCLNKNCKSDYVRFNERGYCQRCLQKLEYYRREQPQVFAKIVANLQEVAR